jgi:hypothetical protein
VFLPISSKERFVLLTLSPAFTRGDIRGIPGNAAQTADDTESADDAQTADDAESADDADDEWLPDDDSALPWDNQL